MKDATFISAGSRKSGLGTSTIAWRYQQPGLAVDHDRERPGLARCDDRPRKCHGLDHDAAEGLGLDRGVDRDDAEHLGVEPRLRHDGPRRRWKFRLRRASDGRVFARPARTRRRAPRPRSIERRGRGARELRAAAARQGRRGRDGAGDAARDDRRDDPRSRPSRGRLADRRRPHRRHLRSVAIRALRRLRATSDARLVVRTRFGTRGPASAHTCRRTDGCARRIPADRIAARTAPDHGDGARHELRPTGMDGDRGREDARARPRIKAAGAIRASRRATLPRRHARRQAKPVAIATLLGGRASRSADCDRACVIPTSPKSEDPAGRARPGHGRGRAHDVRPGRRRSVEISGSVVDGRRRRVGDCRVRVDAAPRRRRQVVHVPRAFRPKAWPSRYWSRPSSCAKPSRAAST